MNFGVGDYYSLVGNRYVKHANVQVIGVDSKQPYCQENSQKGMQPHTYQSQKNITKQSVIKEEEIQYDLQQSVQSTENVKKKRHFNNSKLRDKTEVISLYIKDEANEAEQYATYSLIANNKNENRTNTKQKLQDLQKLKLKSEYREDSSYDDKELYLELEKQRKKRMDLQKEYKKLLSTIQNSESSLQFQENGRGFGSQRKRQYFKRTPRENKDQKLLLSSQSARLRNPGIRMRNRINSSQLYNTQQISQKQHNQNQYATSQETNQLNQQEDASHYSSNRSDKQFQESLIQQMQQLYQKIEKIDSFLGYKQKMLQNQALKRQIAMKEKQIARIKEVKLSDLSPSQSIKVSQESAPNNTSAIIYDLSFINKMQTTTLYVGCLAIMIFIAILV